MQNAISNGQWGDLAKTMGKYAAKEIPFAVGQTALQQGISAAGGDQQFGENFGQQLAGNIVGDLAVDLTGLLDEDEVEVEICLNRVDKMNSLRCKD